MALFSIEINQFKTENALQRKNISDKKQEFILKDI